MRSFWKGKKVLITGHTGFKGAWLCFWLRRLGADLVGISLPPVTSPDLFTLLKLEKDIEHHICDIRDAKLLNDHIQASNIDIVFHLAAQSLVRHSYDNPLETFSSNIMGTANVLDAIRLSTTIRSAVIVTTDKVYENKEIEYAYQESDRLGGYDPYSASKAAAELVVASYRNSFFYNQGVAVSSARAGNVIGGGDWAKDRLIPDAIKLWDLDKQLAIRSPNAIRPWQHVLEPLNGYLRLAELLWDNPELADAYNFGPLQNSSLSVKDVIKLAQEFYGKGDVAFSGEDGPHEAGLLMLDSAKATEKLGFSPKLNIKQSIAMTMDWYKKFSHGESAESLCLADLKAYETLNV